MIFLPPGVLQQQVLSGSFSPGDITWHSMFWAEGEDFVAQGYSDTDTVGTWPNETGETDAVQSTEANKPVYTADVASLNNTPAVVYADNTDTLKAAAFSVNPSYASGITIVAIGGIGVSSGYRTLVDGSNAARNCIQRASSAKWQLYAGTAITGGTFNTSPHMFVAFFDGSTGVDTLEIDGSSVVSGSAGSSKITGISIGNYYNGNYSCNGPLAFAGVYEGDFTSDPLYADFKTWVSDHYGLTIA